MVMEIIWYFVFLLLGNRRFHHFTNVFDRQFSLTDQCRIQNRPKT